MGLCGQESAFGVDGLEQWLRIGTTGESVDSYARSLRWGRNQLVADLLHGADNLPLRDFVHRVDVKTPLPFHSVLVSLMHRVYANVARLSARLGLPPLADGDCSWLGL